MICVSEKMLKILKNDLHNLFSKLSPIALLEGQYVMPGLYLQLNRRKSRAPPPTQPSLIFKDLRRLRCWWSPTLKIYDG